MDNIILLNQHGYLNTMIVKVLSLYCIKAECFLFNCKSFYGVDVIVRSKSVLKKDLYVKIELRIGTYVEIVNGKPVESLYGNFLRLANKKIIKEIFCCDWINVNKKKIYNKLIINYSPAIRFLPEYFIPFKKVYTMDSFVNKVRDDAISITDDNIFFHVVLISPYIIKDSFLDLEIRKRFNSIFSSSPDKIFKSMDLMPNKVLKKFSFDKGEKRPAISFCFDRCFNFIEFYQTEIVIKNNLLFSDKNSETLLKENKIDLSPAAFIKKLANATNESVFKIFLDNEQFPICTSKDKDIPLTDVITNDDTPDSKIPKITSPLRRYQDIFNQKILINNSKERIPIVDMKMFNIKHRALKNFKRRKIFRRGKLE